MASSSPANANGDLSQASLREAQAKHLHDGLAVANFGSTLVCLLFGAFYLGRGFDLQVMLWLALGLSATLLRLVLARTFRFEGRIQDRHARWFLGLATLATAVSALMYGWGWWQITPHLKNADEQIAYLMINVAMLFGGLYAYSPFLPCYFTFSLIGLLPAFPALLRQTGNTGGVLGTLVGLGLVVGVSGLFAVRYAANFRTQLALRDRIFGLLDEVTAKRDQAVAATLAKSRFLASVSHDLRQPMQAINLYLMSLSGYFAQLRVDPTSSEAGERVQSGIDSLRESTHYLNGMFESLLDISRLDAGAVTAQRKRVPLERLIRTLEADCERLAQAAGLRFEVRLPDQADLIELDTDPALLERLLRNLLVNALRYTERGGVRLSVRMRARMLDFRIVDTGPGIDRAVRTAIFEEFFQVPRQPAPAGSVAATGRGIGLGLSIASRLARTLETQVRLHSKLGLGSVFAVRLPGQMSLRQRPAPAAPCPDAAAKRLFATGTLVAVVDDDAEICRSTRLLLESLGAEVFTATSGSDAVRSLGALGRRPDLLVSDYRLVDETGLEVVERIREEFNHDIPAVLITGDTSAELLPHFAASGLRVLHKPISGEQLIQALIDELSKP
jgi:signal transduction histidine kinase